MTFTDFLLPVFVQVLLIFLLLGFMGRERLGSLSSGEVKADDVLLSDASYTTRARQFGNCFRNQFELPMLFFVLIAFLLITRLGDILMLALAWAFVLTRYAHAYIHTTSNDLNWRFRAYAVGVVVLAAMWVLFAIKVLTGV
ncbi:MAPEG family protein [Hyphomicrobium sp.]|uniref:MAPEG family protein n=1 Tax=Hyphomicrobium sp. TaxID=82 RepID=UPI002D77DA08|nr:MAPEG family protein [Hyphomicrobium sp.]HET6389380.1 MAPEG family protein [Hyphomicrobium sp.]